MGSTVPNVRSATAADFEGVLVVCSQENAFDVGSVPEYLVLAEPPVTHDRRKEHGAFSTPAGRPQRSNAARDPRVEGVTHVLEPMRNAGGET
jgi:hypothetical protein